MRPIEVEAWALRVLARVDEGGQLEDSRVELKGAWIEDRNKVARQIAGHCNAARGDDVLWIFGVDEKTGVTGVTAEDFASWWPSVVAEFDGAAPTPTDLALQHGGKQLVALHLTSDRAPFVVRNPAFGRDAGVRIALEVPWREGTTTRTATRADLLTLLVPLQELPEFEIRKATLSVFPDRQDAEGVHFMLRVEAYVAARPGVAIVIPEHRCEGRIELVESDGAWDFQPTFTTPGGSRFMVPINRDPAAPVPRARLITTADGQALIEGPGFMTILDTHEPPSARAVLPDVTTAKLRLRLAPVGASRHIEIGVEMTRPTGVGLGSGENGAPLVTYTYEPAGLLRAPD